MASDHNHTVTSGFSVPTLGQSVSNTDNWITYTSSDTLEMAISSSSLLHLLNTNNMTIGDSSLMPQVSEAYTDVTIGNMHFP